MKIGVEVTCGGVSLTAWCPSVVQAYHRAHSLVNELHFRLHHDGNKQLAGALSSMGLQLCSTNVSARMRGATRLELTDGCRAVYVTFWKVK